MADLTQADWLSSPSVELPPGTALLDGRFTIGSVLGRGGGGITYQADDNRLRRRVAVKELFPEAAIRSGRSVRVSSDQQEIFEQAKVRFLREARLLARFSHPGIVRVYEVFEQNDSAYLVLELLDGTSIAQLLSANGEPLTEEQALLVARRVGEALSVVHKAGLLHRDVSPSNLVAVNASTASQLASARIVLIDFGLARGFSPDQTTAMTRMVTPGYAPPEQYLSEARYSNASDVYGLAATLYRLLTAAAVPSAIDRQTGAELVAPYRLNPKVSKAVSDAVLDGLELDAGHRPRTVEEFLSRLGVDSSIRYESLASLRQTAATAAAVYPTEPTVLEPHSVGSVPRDAEATRMGAPPQGPPAIGPQVDAATYLPGAVIGPRRRGRWVVSLPLGLAAVAACVAAPVLGVGLLVLVGLPLLATGGDLAIHQHRRNWGAAESWFQRRSTKFAAAPRFGRNLVVSGMRALPSLALLAVLVACWHPIHDRQRLASAADWFLRLSGLAVGLLLVVPALRGSRRFASGVAIDAAHLSITNAGRGPLNHRGWILWAVCFAIAAAALALRPDVWPLQG